ncbi:HD-GYP domain-containing protein, partial [bacterium]
EENFRRSMDESPLGIRIEGANDETLYANQALLDIYGYKDIKELNATPVKKRYTPESYAAYQLRNKKRMNGEDYPPVFHLDIIRKTSEISHLRVFRKEVLWSGQKHFQSIYRDITDQKKAEEKLQETLNSLRMAFGGIIQVLSATTEKRDPYTAGHQKRVADLARAIGQEMGLAAERVEGIRLAGIIHDIGKVSIPAEILSKPTRLTKIEYNLIQTHSASGYDILQDIEFSWPIAEMVLQHHERLDGSGYPRGLKGDDILLEARILAICDVVEAMASHRPYRPALGIDAALEEIEKNIGILYDPEAAAACLKLFREKDFKFKL